MTTFKRHDLPIAFTLMEAAERVKARRDGSEHFHRYFLRWTAFQTIYSTLAARKGLHPSLRRDKTGAPVTVLNGSARIPVVDAVSERNQLQLALTELDDSTRKRLLTHSAARFFADRTPAWEGKKIQTDASGQRLNGVILLSHTISEDHPVWNPIELSLFEQYLDDPSAGPDQDFLTGQLADILFAGR